MRVHCLMISCALALSMGAGGCWDWSRPEVLMEGDGGPDFGGGGGEAGGPDLDKARDQNAPVPDGTAPKPDKNAPPPDQAPPKPDKKVPKLDQKASKPDKKVPKPDQKVPPPDQSPPKPDKKVPPPDQAPPKPDKKVWLDAAPLPDKKIIPDKPPPKPDLPQLLVNGKPCTSGSQCQTGRCVDKVCCNVSCTVPCKACNLPGKEGTCLYIAAGQDPDNECSATSPGTCGQDGACDGKGKCRLHAKGTQCKTGQCSSFNGKILGLTQCDGAGSCNVVTSISCAPFSCDTTTHKCFTSCSKSKHCPGYYGCNKATGKCYTTCTNDNQCNGNGECEKGKCVED